MSTVIQQPAMPEWLTRKDIDSKSWTVEQGSPARGEAWTVLVEGRMRVPHGGDELSRTIRAHEMTHAKVSPMSIYRDGRYGASEDSLICAEEFRVNTLVGLAGFDVENLADGSEHTAGEVAGQNMDWNSAVRSLAAFAGTKSAAAFIRGVRKHNPEMAATLTQVHKELKKKMKAYVKTGRLASTNPVPHWSKEENDAPHPEGWGFTVKLATYIDSLLISNEGSEDADGDPIPRPEEVKSNGVRGRWGTLIEKKIPKPVKVDGHMGRKRVATDIGRNPRRIGRMLTDPERRVFDRRTKGKGGIVLIDQSGSMHLNNDDVWKIISKAPGCIIIGYSHRPGSTDIPNIWVMADRGSVCESVPHGGSGNGVDGPALRFALKMRRSGEPFIWVCDGQVTDHFDNMADNLAKECAELVVRNDIHMVRTVEGAVDALSKAGRGERLPTSLIGSLAGWQNIVARESKISE